MSAPLPSAAGSDDRVVASPDLEQRLLIFTPIGKDSMLISGLLAKEGIACLACTRFDELVTECEAGVAVVLLAEEVMASDGMGPFAEWIAQQPAWSDIPVLTLTRPGADSPAVGQIVARLGNVTLLERPSRVATLLSAARAAFRARRRQYQVRDQLEALQRGAAALRHSEAELLNADRRKNEFLATLAHELRNPLAPVRNALHVMSLDQHMNDSQAKLRAMMSRQVSHMVRMVDDLLDISRITRGSIELQKNVHELSSVIEQAIEISRPSLDGGAHRLRIRRDPNPIYIDGDAVRLIQVLANLLNNSAKYSRTPGIVELTVRREAGFAVISVKDEGIGIAADVLPRVFDMFMQVHDSTNRSHSGLGIGLTLARNLVEMHGGSVTAASAGVGLGSEFTVRLPTCDAPDAGTPRPLAGNVGIDFNPFMEPTRVLVVDDNADAATSFGTLLGLLGVRVAVAFGGKEGLLKLEQFEPAIAFVDIGMPDLDGYEFARTVRSHEPALPITLIALTGWGQKEDRRRSADAGYDQHLVKPVGFETVRDVLQQLGVVTAAPTAGESG